MADASSALSSSEADPFAALAGGPQAIVARTDKALAGKPDAALNTFTTKLSDAEAKRDTSLSAIGNERGNLTPPVPENPTPAPEEKTTDPKKAWGSAAMMFAVFGSMLTRQPMTAALNAAAGVINGFHEGDLEKAQREFQKWQVESTNATKMYEYQQQAYSRILAEMDRREKMAGSTYDSDTRAAAAEFRGLATSYKDQVALAAFDMGGWKAVEALTRDREAAHDKMVLAGPKMEEEYNALRLQREAINSPEYKAAADAGDYKAQARILRDSSPKSAEAFDYKMMSNIENQVKALQNSKIGQAYFTLKGADSAIAKAEKEIGNGNVAIDGISSNSLVDIYARAVGGGVARRFLVDALNVHNTTLDQRADRLLGTFDPKGGGMSAQQARMLIGAINEQKNGVYTQYTQQANAAAALVGQFGDEYAEQLRKRAGVERDGAGGETPNRPASSGGKAPPPQAVSYLRQHPEMKAQFDEKFGKGAAERILEGGSTGSHSSGDFRPVSDVRPIIEKLYPGAHITSWERQPEDRLTQANPNSWHARGGAAADVRPIQGISFEDYVQGFRNAGFHVIEARDEAKHPEPWTTGPNWHVVLGEKDA